MPGKIYEQYDLDADDDEFSAIEVDEDKPPLTQREGQVLAAQTGAANTGQRSENPRLAQDTEMLAVDEGTKAAKRKLGSNKAQTMETQGEDKTEWFMEQLKQKDALIANLSAMMEGMRQQLHALQASLDQLTKQKVESCASNENL